jgi:phenylpropionate dioxygenase-like ring-hydroxylating dioxygenase large terminal subunit
MFPRNFWYVAAMSHELEEGALLPRTLLNGPVLLFRRRDGSAAAIEDRCSHRRVSLSLGKLVGDYVQCGYHGLTFGGDGECVRIPNQDRIPSKACIRAYPLVERDGFLWIWMGDKVLARSEEVPDFSAICSSDRFLGRRGDALHVAAPHTYNLENVMDLSHVSFAHERTVGTKEVAETKPQTTVHEREVIVHREWERIPAAPVFRRLFGWDVVKRTQTIRFWPGANVQLDITSQPVGNADPALVRSFHVIGPCTPETNGSHFKFSTMYRNFALDDETVTQQLAEGFLAAIMEDKALMENQWRNMTLDGPGARMIDIAVDQAPLATRRMLKKLADAEHASANADATLKAVQPG